MKGKIFLISVILLWSGVLYKSGFLTPKPKFPLKVKIVQARSTLKVLDEPYKIKRSKIIKIDKLYFPERNYLYHYLYGNLKFYKNFLMFIETEFEMLKSQKITFYINSDDGFRLKIDGKKICEYTKDRPFGKTVCDVTLKKGLHKMSLKYFQGYGRLGLVGVYEINGKKYYIGENSKYIKFYENN